MASKSKIKGLKSRGDFLRIQQKGRRFYPSRWMIFNYLKNDNQSFRLGFTIGRKVGNAVLRNRLRRWSREFFRNEKIKIDLDLNVIFKQTDNEFYSNLSHKELDEILSKGWQNLRKLV